MAGGSRPQTSEAVRRFDSIEGMSAFADVVGDGLLVVDSRQKIVVFNEGAERVFGYSRGEVLGESLGLLLPDRFRTAHAGEVSQFRSRGMGHRVSASGRSRVVGRRKDGEEFPAEITLTALEVAGEVMGSAVVRDVSSRVETERALAESEERFRVVFESSPVAMALGDTEGVCIAANLALADRTGYRVEDLVGMPMADLVVPEDLSIMVEGINRLLSGDDPAVRMELRQRDASGDTGVVDLSLALVVDGEGQPQYVIGQSLDISDRVEAQSALEEMLRSKDELIASVSHELRTPLTALVGFARLLRDDESATTPLERREMIEAIAAQSADLTNIVEDLLVAAKAETEALTVVHVPVDLKAQAAQVLETWNQSEVDHISVVGPALVGVGDPARVRQILRNLVANALRYGGEQVVVRTSGDETTVRIAVGDNGPPIEESDLERIFLPYQRAHETVGVTASIGFGLYVSRQLAQLMNGDLTYRRQEDENRFELTLPRSTDLG
ncbi:MAG: PAS domain-containing sensor histidine kinase [Actinomycetota bacterium]